MRQRPEKHQFQFGANADRTPDWGLFKMLKKLVRKMVICKMQCLYDK